MNTVSVTNLELYRIWRENEGLDMAWLVARLFHPEQTEPMKVGQAFHSCLEHMLESEIGVIAGNGYTFRFLCDCPIERGQMRELLVAGQYGDLTVRGRVDAVTGRTVIDYKTTEYFDADRLLEGYQWRFYLDLTGLSCFRWYVFELTEGDEANEYLIRGFHKLEQRWYPELHTDCRRLALDYAGFAGAYLTEATLKAFQPSVP